jgi:hypothetical protein
MAERVVELLEAVEVEEDERDAVSVAARTLQLHLELTNEGLVVEEACELVVACLVGELGRGALEVRDHAIGHEPLEGRMHAFVRDELGEYPPQQKELAHDLARREAERLTLAHVLAATRGERAAVPQVLGLRLCELPRQLPDERRQVAELAKPPETLKRGDPVVEQAFLDGRQGELPGRGPDRVRELVERRRFASFHAPIMKRPADTRNRAGTGTLPRLSSPTRRPGQVAVPAAPTAGST